MKNTIKCSMIKLIKIFSSKFLSEHDKNFFYAEVSKHFIPKIMIETKNGIISFFCPDKLPIWRAETFFEKEPGTLEWVNNMKKGSLLWDIGANVGCYSLYAGKAGIKTISFEPSAANYYILNKNISDNNLDEIITAYCIAFTEINDVGHLNMDNLDLGGAMNTFSDEQNIESSKLDSNISISKFKQGMIGFSIDSFIDFFGLAIPNYIKIDVDGLEYQILMGADKTLKNPELISILVENDDADTVLTEKTIKLMNKYGFTIDSKQQLGRTRKSADSTLYNYIFIRAPNITDD